MIFFLFLFGKRIFSKIWKIWKMSLEIIYKDDYEINVVRISSNIDTLKYELQSQSNKINNISHLNSNTNHVIDILDEEYSII